MRLTHLDLFSGIGGFALAAGWAGFETIGFCEIYKYCQQVLRKHWPSVRCHSDIRTLNGSEYIGVDLLTGGFPCQPFSNAGKQRGKEDDRHLWPEMLRVIKESKPTWVLAENVPGIIGMELDGCLSDLENLGYETGTLVVPACAVDARHRRDRVWVMANSKVIKWNERFDQCGKEKVGYGRIRVETGTSCDNSCLHLHGSTPWSWITEPELGRVAYGIPNRSHRLRALGNAVVPQVAYEIIRHIPTIMKNFERSASAGVK